MAFEDLFSSARGPGVVGMIMALIVLLGFGVLFMFAFDEGSQGGGKSLAFIIRNQKAEIEAFKSGIESGNAKIDAAPQLKAVSAKLSQSLTLNKSLVNRISASQSQLKSLESGIGDLREEWADYKNQYRSFVRGKATDTSLSELKTSDGTVYVDVDIRKVSAIGMDIRHRDGFKRIGFENLPEEIQDYYQFDKDQMLAEAEREAKIHQKLSQEVDAANLVAEGQMADQRVKNAEQAKQKTLLTIADKESRVSAVEGEIRQLEQDIVSAEAAAAAARSAGKMHLNRAGSLRGTLSSKRAALSQLQADILRMRSSIQ